MKSKVKQKTRPKTHTEDEIHDPNSFEELKTQICDILVPRERKAMAARRRRKNRN